MKRFATSLGVDQIRAVIGGEFVGEAKLSLSSVSEPREAGPDTIIFCEQEKYFEAVQASAAGLIICSPACSDRLPGRNLLITDKPYFALMRLVSWWLHFSEPRPQAGIHPLAQVGKATRLGEGVAIAAGVSIGKNCVIADNAIIEANCQIGDNVSIGANTHLYPNVSVYADTIIGKEAIIHSGCVVGADGFGFLLLEGIQQKIPQIGNVVIGDHVEIGANTTIDRATLGSTKIGEGTKIDNLVQIGHNCQVGRHCILCAQVGLAGSTIVGDYVYLAGQVGVAGHLSIGDRAMVGAQAGVTHDIPADGRYFGSPAEEAGLMKRIMASQKKLPELYRFYLKQRNHKGE